MLFLTFRLGKDRYAVDVKQVREILPMVEYKSIPQAPPWVLGIFNYHGEPVPLIDPAALSLGTPAAKRMSTRILLVDYRQGLLGLMVEHATDVMRRAETEFKPSRVASGGAPYLGPVLADGEGILQKIEVQALLSDEVHSLLFPEEKS
jgi:chemotaxis-related protein WspB